MQVPPIQTPLLLLWFNRPNHAQKVLDRLRAVRPTTIYVVIDGPREEHPTDAIKVQQTVALFDTIDWPCTLHPLIREQNLGCKHGVSSAISWFFEQVEEGIILEDDCLPDPTFFSFCAALLDRYRTDEQIMHIGGANLVATKWWGTNDYLFTKVCHIWGWATWRRAWQKYDVSMSHYPQKRGTLVEETVEDRSSQRLWKQAFEDSYAGRIDTWDYQWVYAIWAAGGLGILPRINLVTNIGFDAQATHTKQKTEFAQLPAHALLSITHPSSTIEQVEATQWLFKQLYTPPNLFSTLLLKLKKLALSFTI